MKLLRIRGGNWGIKLLSLALAIFIYYAIKHESASGGHSHDRNIFQQSR